MFAIKIQSFSFKWSAQEVSFMFEKLSEELSTETLVKNYKNFSFQEPARERFSKSRLKW